jgi:hypothetical protein
MISSTDGLRLAPGDAVDLQLHTDFSDGRWTLEALLEHLRRERFALAAITDHDRVDTVATVQQAAREMGVPVLVAVEMTSAWEGGMVDLLCFGFDPAHGALHALAQGLWARQRENSREVHVNLQRLGCDVGHEVLATVIARPSSQQPQAWVDALRERAIGPAGRRRASSSRGPGARSRRTIPPRWWRPPTAAAACACWRTRVAPTASSPSTTSGWTASAGRCRSTGSRSRTRCIPRPRRRRSGRTPGGTVC